MLLLLPGHTRGSWGRKEEHILCAAAALLVHLFLTLKTVHAPQSGRIGADEAINDAEGKESEELEEILNEKEAKTRAILLEMVRDKSRYPWTPAPM